MNFNIGPYKDDVLCDVLPMSACHVLLGRPWQYDRGAIYDFRRNLLTIEKHGQNLTLASLKEKEKEVNKLSLVNSCNGEKYHTQVIPDAVVDLKKDLVDGSVSAIVSDDSEFRVVVAEKMGSRGRNRSNLRRKASRNKRQCASMKHGKRVEEKKMLENLAEVLQEVRKKFANKEDIWIRNVHGIYIPHPFQCP